jgi:peptide/nickel transport system substrate-binding protein
LAPLRDVRVRQAIGYAIDRETMRRYLVGEGSRVIHVECHPDQLGCADEGAARYDFDPAKARGLLADAGYPDGFDLDLYASRDRNQIDAIIGYLKAVGIRARLRFVQSPAINAAIRAGKAPLVYATWGDPTRDLASSVSVFHEFSFLDQSRDPEIRDLLQKADSSMDPQARKELYAKALRLIAEHAYSLPLYTIPSNYLATKDLDLGHPPDGLPKFYDMSWK